MLSVSGKEGQPGVVGSGLGTTLGCPEPSWAQVTHTGEVARQALPRACPEPEKTPWPGAQAAKGQTAPPKKAGAFASLTQRTPGLGWVIKMNTVSFPVKGSIELTCLIQLLLKDPPPVP